MKALCTCDGGLYQFNTCRGCKHDSGKTTPQRVHPRDFVQVTHSDAPERFWVQVVKHKDGVVWGIVDNSLIFVDWPRGKKIRFSMCRVFDVYAGAA